MNNKYFGTDGIRGTVNKNNITGDKFFRFGIATGAYFKTKKNRKAIIAKDTRLSGYMLEPALVSGLISTGINVFLLGPLPSNGLAMLTKSMRADLGIMITASHNLHIDNGIKLFGPDGLKLSDKIEKHIERLIDRKIQNYLVEPTVLGRAKRLEDANARYIEILKSNFPRNFNLDGMKIVLDCANGAGYKVGPAILTELGAKVIPLGTSPDGLNINKDCGSTFPQSMQKTVLKHKADIGIALDGDADRVIVCDEKGSLVDGDQILALIAKRWKNKKILNGGVIATHMSNIGLENFFKKHHINFIRTKVGDRHVKEKMRTTNYNLGGEQSGHIILGDMATTGDGILVSLEVLYILKKYKQNPKNIFHILISQIFIKNKKIMKKAIFYYNKSIALNPKNILAYNNLGTLLSTIGNYNASNEKFNKIIEIDPTFYHAYNNLLMNTCYWKNNINYLNIAKKYNNRIKVYKENFLSNQNSQEKILKIGIISADLRTHSVGLILNSFLKNLKKKKLKLYAYYNYHLCDNITKSLQSNFHEWNKIYKVNDLDVIKIIRKDKLDILLDLSGHSQGNRLSVFKNRCAPIQATWCGWLASSGISEMDYIIGDPYATPVKDKNKFTEKIYQLNKILFCLSKPNLNLDLKIENNNKKNIIFGCFGKTNKINLNVIEAWSKILLNVKNSKLFLKHGNYESQFFRNNILEKFKKHNVKNDKIEFENHSPMSEYFNTYNKIDINLDTFPWNGGVTTFESSYMGVPTLTLENNDTYYLRVGESINNNQNMINWIAKNENDYILKAVEFAENKKSLTNFKKEIRNNALKSPLFNTEDFANDFYEMLLNISR